MQYIVLTEVQRNLMNSFTPACNNRLKPVLLENGDYILNANCLTEKSGVFAAYFNEFTWLDEITPVDDLPSPIYVAPADINSP